MNTPTINTEKTGDYHGKANKSVIEGQHEATHVERKAVGLLAPERTRGQQILSIWVGLYVDGQVNMSIDTMLQSDAANKFQCYAVQQNNNNLHIFKSYEMILNVIITEK